MAIRRCPYCKAIIDEQDKYCNNCGTQLLFPEDEFADEEIPGDKIVDDEEDEKETEKEEPDEEPELEEEIEEEELVEDEEEAEKGEEEPEAEESADEEEGKEEGRNVGDKAADDETEEEEPAEEEEAEAEEEAEEEDEELEKAEEAGDAGSAAPADEETAGEAETHHEEELEEELGEEEADEEVGEELPGESGHDELSEPSAGSDEAAVPQESAEGEEDEAAGRSDLSDWKVTPAEVEKKYEVSLERDELVFKTKDIEQMTRMVDEGKQEFESFLESHPDFPARDTSTDTKEGLPPWASRIRETPAIVEPTGEDEEGAGPKRRWTTDSGIGVPEKITTAEPGRGDTGSRAMETQGEEREGVEEETEAAVEEVEGARRPPSLSMKLRAKVVDWVFVTALWLISLGFASKVLEVSFFRLIFGSTLLVLAFYAILLALYFFLFLYFLGETLGDHYFTDED